MNSPGSTQFARHLALRPERRDKRNDGDQTRFDEQLGDLGDASNVFDAVALGEAEIAIEPMTDIVAIEHEGMFPESVKLFFQLIRDRRLAGARQTGEPQQRRLLRIKTGSRRFGDIEGLEIGISGAPQPEADHARRHRRIGMAIDQDESAGVAIFVVWIEADRLGGRDIDECDFVEPQFLGGEVIEIFDVDFGI